MELSEKIKKIETAPGCPYDRSDLIERVASGRMLSPGQSRFLSSLGVDDDRINSTLKEQSEETRLLEFEALADIYKMSNQTLAKILGKSSQSISYYRNGRSPIPPKALATLRRIVAAIDDAK